METIVVEDVSVETVTKLEQLAAEHGRSLSEETRQIIEDAMERWRPEEVRRIRREEAWRAMDQFRSEVASQGLSFPDSAEIIRRHRDG